MRDVGRVQNGEDLASAACSIIGIKRSILFKKNPHITPLSLTLPSITGRSSPSLPSSTLLFLLVLPSFAALIERGFSCTNYPGGTRHSPRPESDPDRAGVTVRLTFDVIDVRGPHVDQNAISCGPGPSGTSGCSNRLLPLIAPAACVRAVDAHQEDEGPAAKSGSPYDSVTLES